MVEKSKPMAHIIIVSLPIVTSTFHLFLEQFKVSTHRHTYGISYVYAKHGKKKKKKHPDSKKEKDHLKNLFIVSEVPVRNKISIKSVLHHLQKLLTTDTFPVVTFNAYVLSFPHFIVLMMPKYSEKYFCTAFLASETKLHP